MIQSKQASPHSLTGANPYPWIRWWYALAAPRATGNEEEMSLKEREFLRQGRLASIALLISLIEALLEIGAPLQAGQYVAVVIILVTMGSLLISVFLNRSRKLLSAGILLIAMVEIGMAYTLFVPVGGSMASNQVIMLVLLIQPLMFSVLLFPAWGIFVVGAVNIVIVILVVLFVPKTLELQLYMQTPLSNTIFAVPILALVVCSLVSFIVITSLRETLARADKAEEVNKLHQILSEQTRRELQAKQQLEIGIQEIVTGMTFFSNGDQQARIHLEQKHLLWPVAASINNLIGRFVRIRMYGQQSERISQALQAYLVEVRTAKVAGKALPLPKTGTPVDALVAELLSIAKQTHPENIYSPFQPKEVFYTPVPPTDHLPWTENR